MLAIAAFLSKHSLAKQEPHGSSSGIYKTAEKRGLQRLPCTRKVHHVSPALGSIIEDKQKIMNGLFPQDYMVCSCWTFVFPSASRAPTSTPLIPHQRAVLAGSSLQLLAEEPAPKALLGTGQDVVDLP